MKTILLLILLFISVSWCQDTEETLIQYEGPVNEYRILAPTDGAYIVYLVSDSGDILTEESREYTVGVAQTFFFAEFPNGTYYIQIAGPRFFRREKVLFDEEPVLDGEDVTYHVIDFSKYR